MKVKRFDIWLANLSPQKGTEAGKTRPVLVVQTNLLNDFHLSTVICPLTTNVSLESEILRVHIQKGECGLDRDTDVLIDQVRSIDNKRFLKFIGKLSKPMQRRVEHNLKVVLDLGW